jgi:S-DNA-T family DNA segregation ATPase FtsK/SpoIIIE
MVVNHIANKRIQQKRQQRLRQSGLEEEAYVPEAPKQKTKAQKAQERATPVQVVPAEVVSNEKTDAQRAAELMSQIAVLDEPEFMEDSEDLTTVFTPVEKSAKAPRKRKTPAAIDEIPAEMPAFVPDEPIPEAPKAKPVDPINNPNAKISSKDAAESAQQVAEEIAQNQAAAKPVYCFPPIDLLKAPGKSSVDGTLEMKENSKRLNETLASFKIDAHIINVTRGPSVTRYEVELDKGVRLNKLTSCADDIALSLGASGVRIAAVPGRIDSGGDLCRRAGRDIREFPAELVQDGVCDLQGWRLCRRTAGVAAV